MKTEQLNMNSTKKDLAKIAFYCEAEKDLLGRKHKPRISCPNTGKGIWDWRSALSRAELDVDQIYYNSKRAWTYVWATNLTIEQLNTVARLKKHLRYHRAQLAPKPVSTHDSRKNFGVYLKGTFGLVKEERREVYDLTEKGETTNEAVKQVLLQRNDKTAPHGKSWVAVCCHRHYARGSHALNSVSTKEFPSWVEAQNYADSYNCGKHGWATVELRDKAHGCCHTCGKQMSLDLPSICKICSDAWPKVSREEMRELEELEAQEDAGCFGDEAC